MISDIHLPLTPKTDFEFLSKFLRVKKYDPDLAVVAVQRYYENIFRNLRRIEGIRPSHFLSAYGTNTVVVLKNRVQGARVVCGSVRNWDTKVCGLRELQCASLFQVEDMLKDVKAQEVGGLLILDLAGLGFCHARQCTVPEIRTLIHTGLVSLQMIHFKIKRASITKYEIKCVFNYAKSKRTFCCYRKDYRQELLEFTSLMPQCYIVLSTKLS